MHSELSGRGPCHIPEHEFMYSIPCCSCYCTPPPDRKTTSRCPWLRTQISSIFFLVGVCFGTNHTRPIEQNRASTIPELVCRSKTLSRTVRAILPTYPTRGTFLAAIFGRTRNSVSCSPRSSTAKRRCCARCVPNAQNSIL